jgi:hypothetical protein
MLTTLERDRLLRRLLAKGSEVSEALTRILAGEKLDLERLLGGGEPGETPAERLRRFLDLLDERIQAARHGRYGFCDQCGSALPFAELDAVPWQRTCRRCALSEAHL